MTAPPADERAPARLAAAAARSALALALALAPGCAESEPASAGRLEGVDRVEVGRGRHVDAVRSTARLSVTGRRARLRGRLAGEGAQAGCFLDGGDGTRSALAAGDGADGPGALVDHSLESGEWTLRCTGGARLEEPRLVARESSSPRLAVLVVVDTLRDDFVAPATMPRTLAALDGARRFIDVRANASWTLPSLASALTSRPVLELTAPDGVLIGIPPGLPTLAERLRAAGFATAAFVANGTLREANGFGQGFARFETTAEPSDAPSDAGPLFAAARRWIAEHEGEDAFVWLHLMEPHEPLRDHTGRGRTAVDSKTLAGRERAPTPAEAATFRDLYRLEVAHADELLGLFLRGLPASTTVALTADHGEMLGEGTVWGHGLTLYEGVLQVPLLLSAPGVATGRDDRPAELLDLVPTLLARLDVAAPAGSLAGVDLLSRARRDRPRLAATFSAGPLRWAYRRGDLAVLAHFAPLGAGSAAAAVVHEEEPLPVGLWAYAPGEEPVGGEGAPLAGAALAEVAAAFARDAGQMVPGYHALVVEQPGDAELALSVSGGGQLAQLHATAAPRIARDGDRLSLSWPAAQPLALVAFGRGVTVRPLGTGWRVGDRTPPPIEAPGRVLWRNSRAATAQHPQAEILEHLRALGYLR